MIVLLLRALASALLLALPTKAAEQPPSPARLMDDLMWGRGPIGGAFTLTDHTGRPRTDAEFRGKLLLIYFGYTYCPDVCPTDLMAIASALDALGIAGEAVQPIFITVDPERDTAARLADYVAAFHPRLIGLTGAPDEIRRIAIAYKAYYARVEGAGVDDYVVDHTSFIYLIERDGRYAGFFPPGTTAERLVEMLRPLLAAR